ncbi:sulfatase-like hydrolase/transferase [Escherichia coli]
MPSVRTQSDEQTATQWINWLCCYAQEDNRWLWVSFNGTNIDDSNQQAFARKYSRAAGNVDDQINCVLNALRDSGKLDNTVVIITAGRGIPLSEDEETFDWSHGSLQVPLVIHWPGTPAQRINAATINPFDDDADATPATCQHTCQRIFARSGFCSTL